MRTCPECTQQFEGHGATHIDSDGKVTVYCSLKCQNAVVRREVIRATREIVTPRLAKLLKES